LGVECIAYLLWKLLLWGEEPDPESLFDGRVAYGVEQLAGVPEQLSLPTDRPRPPVASQRGAQFAMGVDPGVHQGVVALARDGGASGFMVVQCWLAALLSRLGAGSQIPICSPIAGR